MKWPLGILCSLSVSLIAQTPVSVGPSLDLVKHFGAYRGTVQFLPGGRVLVEEEGKGVLYAYRGNDFIVTKDGLESGLDQWRSFDWGRVDFLDQVDLGVEDRAMKSTLPASSRIKKIIDIDGRNSPKGLVLVCYTTKSREIGAFAVDREIGLIALERTSTADREPTYRRVWMRTLVPAASYGELIIQDIPGMATFVLLYSEGAGGSGYSADLDVYTLKR